MFQVVLPEERLTIKRAEVMAQMHAAGIGTGVHYPAIHLFAALPAAGLEGRAISRTPNTPAATF